LIRPDELFWQPDYDSIWKKYCGFLDLSVTEYLGIQESLLMQQIDLINRSSLGKKFMPYKPKSVADFRRIIPFTSYRDYARYLEKQYSGFLPEAQYQWTCADRKDGDVKWIPYTREAILAVSRCIIGSMILACADKKGTVKIGHGSNILHDVPSGPYTINQYASAVARQTGFRFFPDRSTPSPTEHRCLFPQELERYLNSGIDLLITPGSSLYRIGQHLAERVEQIEFNLSPSQTWRCLLAWLKSQREHRPLLPKDVWLLKGLISGGPESTVYKDQICRYWGKTPLLIYHSPEGGILATQGWNKKDYTFLPTSSFLEFIPEEDVLINRGNPDYLPRTLLLNQLKPGSQYEVVISSFYGMPFLRCRLGDLVRITALEDPETGIKLPQMDIVSLMEETIEIGDFCRLNETHILQAIVAAGLKYEDWGLCSGQENGVYYLNVYIELKENRSENNLEEAIDTALVKISDEYRHNRTAQGKPFLKVIQLPPGSFRTYREIHRPKENLPWRPTSGGRYFSPSAGRQLENARSASKALK